MRTAVTNSARSDAHRL